MSLRKSPTLTPALLAASRRNAQKSSGPRTPRGKAWSCRNHLRTGGDSPEYKILLHPLMNAPPGRMGGVAGALLRAQEVRHPLVVQSAEVAVQAEVELRQEVRHGW